MTRFARKGTTTYEKKPHNASSWSELNKRLKSPPNNDNNYVKQRRGDALPVQKTGCDKQQRGDALPVQEAGCYKRKEKYHIIDFKNEPRKSVIEMIQDEDTRIMSESKSRKENTITEMANSSWIHEKGIDAVNQSEACPKGSQKTGRERKRRRQEDRIYQLNENLDNQSDMKERQQEKEKIKFYQKKDISSKQNESILVAKTKLQVEEIYYSIEDEKTKEELTLGKKRKTSLEDKRDRRREERRIKRMELRQESRKCDFCQTKGHQVIECPCKIVDSEFGACLQCGSTDHTVKECNITADHKTRPAVGLQEEPETFGPISDDYSFETSDDDIKGHPVHRCSICNELGHDAKACPDNPRGMYPLGGSCKECGSVEHKWSACPNRNVANGIKDVKITARCFEVRESADAVIDEDPQSSKRIVMKAPPRRKKPKVILF